MAATRYNDSEFPPSPNARNQHNLSFDSTRPNLLEQFSQRIYLLRMLRIAKDCLLTIKNSFYPRDAMLARVIAIATCLSVCLSVRLSITSRYCVKTKKASVMISSLPGSPKILVFWRQISSPNSNGFPERGLKEGWGGKIHRFSSFKRYDTIGEFNVDWKAEYSALSSTRSQKKKLKQPTPVPL